MKRALDLLASGLVLPLILLCRSSMALVPGRRDGIFQGYSQFLSLWPGLTGDFLRRAFYRRTLRSCADECTVSFGTIFATPDVALGRHVYIGPHCDLARVVIGDDTMIGSHVSLLDAPRTHGLDDLSVPMRLQSRATGQLVIGRDVWVGNRATVMAPVAAHAVVGAGSVVTKPVEPYAKVAGNPAKLIGWRTDAALDALTLQPEPIATPA